MDERRLWDSILALASRASWMQAALMNSAEMQVEPVALEGSVVRLEPLRREHHGGLVEVGLDPELWRWIPRPVRTAEEMGGYIATALEEQARGVSLPFATIERQTGRVIGSTRFANIDRQHRRVEIGWTWVAAGWQRSAVNTEAKYLMLRHAFETLGCIRVELKTDSLNEKSRKAIARIGAREEGIFRNHIITASGRIRHTVYYSIVEGEWPAVKTRLEAMLARSGQPGEIAMTGSPNPQNRRRSERVLLQIPLAVLTHGPDRKPVKEETTTMVVNAHGGLMKLRTEVSVGAALVLVNPTTNKQEAARVVRVERPSVDYFAVAFEFNQAAPKFWPVVFPPADWEVK